MTKVKVPLEYVCPFCFSSNKEYKHLKFYRVKVNGRSELMCSYCMQDEPEEEKGDVHE